MHRFGPLCYEDAVESVLRREIATAETRCRQRDRDLPLQRQIQLGNRLNRRRECLLSSPFGARFALFLRLRCSSDGKSTLAAPGRFVKKGIDQK